MIAHKVTFGNGYRPVLGQPTLPKEPVSAAVEKTALLNTLTLIGGVLLLAVFTLSMLSGKD